MAKCTITILGRVLPWSGDLCFWLDNEKPMGRYKFDCISGEYVEVNEAERLLELADG